MSDVILVYPEREGKKRRREREKKEAVPISFCVYFSKVTQTPTELRTGGLVETDMLKAQV